MISLFHASLLLSFTLFIVPKKFKYPMTLVFQLALIASTSSWALEAFQQTEIVTLPLGLSTWSGPIVLTIDKLSAFFILIVDFICLAGILYAGGYLRPYIEKKRAVIISLHLFSFLWLNAAMVLVTAMAWSEDVLWNIYKWISRGLFQRTMNSGSQVPNRSAFNSFPTEIC